MAAAVRRSSRPRRDPGRYRRRARLAAGASFADAENPWRTEDARDCNIGAHRFADYPDDSFTPTVSDLADVSAQSIRPDRFGRLFYGSDHPAASLVRVLVAGASPTGSAPLQRHRSPHVRMGCTTDGRGIR